MKTLVTGATGLLGANVVQELESRGKEVRVLVRPGAGLTALEGTKPEFFQGDLTDVGKLRQAMKDCDAVVHAAANTSQWPVGYSFYEPVNVTGTQNVMQACRDSGIRRIVHVSTANAFGPGPKERPGTELSEFSGFRQGSGYVISKYVAQQEVLAMVEKTGLPAVIVNPTFMIGPRDAKPSSGRILMMGLKGKVQAYPAGGKNFIHVRDAAAGVCNALEHGRPGECYLLANENHSYGEFFSLLNKVAGRRPLRLRIPSAVLNTAGLAGSLSERISGRPAPLNFVNARLLTLENYYSGRKAVEQLGLPQTPVAEAIADALAWFKSHSRI